MRGTDPRLVLGLYRSSHRRELLESALKLGIGALDTGYNYHGFDSHRILAREAGDLLPSFTISTKVGFFPAAHPEHSLEPVRLRSAIEETVDVLGRPPDIMFLHNPERSLVGLSSALAFDRLAASCTLLRDASASGLCRAWGLTVWNPAPVLDALPDPGGGVPSPDLLMFRVGITVGAWRLDANEELADRLDVAPDHRWGMCPFGGRNADDPLWTTVDPRIFLTPGQRATTHQAAFRLAYDLPEVTRVAVGTDQTAHLRELAEAGGLQIDGVKVARYRRLLRVRSEVPAAR